MNPKTIIIAIAAFAGVVASADPTLQETTPCPTLPMRECRALPNKDRPGSDLKNIQGQVDVCENKCKETPGCVTWSWNGYQGGTCWLKSHGTRPIDREGVWSSSCELNVTSTVCQGLQDVDFVGNDLAALPAREAGRCCNLCNAYPGCKAYAWNDWSGGMCWLKSDVGAIIRKPGVVAAITSVLSGPMCPIEYGVDFVGNDIDNKPGKDVGACCALCKANSNCKAYSWNNWNGGTCWLKSGKGDTVRASGVHSAVLL